MQIGDTFYGRDGGHLWVVISDPECHDGECVAVNMTRDVFRAGKECELNIDDHRWIKEKTYISFGDALKISSKEMLNLEKGIKSGAIRTHYPMKPAVLQRIITAAKHSISLRPELVDLL